MNRPVTWREASRPAPRDDRRPLASAQCSLCGIALPTGLMVPDGGQACTDIRWYCKDAQTCTERWTASLPRHPHIAPTPTSLAAPRETLAASGEPRGEPRLAPLPDPVPADLLGAPPEEAWSIDP